MRTLNKAISAGKPFLVDYQIAEQYLQLKKSAGITDLITQLFGESPKPYTVGSTYVIPIMGMISKGLSPIEAIGATDVEKLDDQIDEALAANPKRILFHINSDGGTIDGVEEIADKIRALPVETIAYTSGSMNSAAFWIGSAADRVIASPSASVGAVGVYSVSTDLSEQAKSLGIKVKVFRNSSSPYKGMGVAGTSLTSEQEALTQAEVDKAGETFKQAVLMKRKLAKPEDMQGQAMSGRDAAARNLITGLAPTLKMLLTQLEGSDTAKPATAQVAKLNKGKQAASSLKLKAQEEDAPAMDQPTLDAADGLNPRQRALVDELEGITETFGAFDQTSLADGSHYVAASPFAEQGISCANCVFYKGGRGCEIVAGDIDPAAVCKFWVIPSKLIK